MKITYDDFLKMRALAKKCGVEVIGQKCNAELLDLSDKFGESDRYSLVSKKHGEYVFYWKLDYRSDTETGLPFFNVNGRIFKMNKKLTIVI